MLKTIAAMVLTLLVGADVSQGDQQYGTPPFPGGRGFILPIQDRTGSPEAVTFLELLVRQEISRIGSLSESDSLRETLRRLRMREVMTSSPNELVQLGEVLGADWFVSTTIHEIDREPVPRVALTAQILRPGSLELEWSGMVALTGLDRETWLGLRRVDSLDDLLRLATTKLFEDLISDSRDSGKNRLKASRSGYLLQPVEPNPDQLMVVVPFGSVTDLNSVAIAELQTRTFLASLHQAGFRVALPGAVLEIMRKRGRLLLGEIDRETAEELDSLLDAEWVLTGTVETYQQGTGLQPDPWVAIGARIIQSGTGQIFWIDGIERRGSDSDELFEQGRIYSAADLTSEMTRSLIAGFTAR